MQPRRPNPDVAAAWSVQIGEPLWAHQRSAVTHGIGVAQHSDASPQDTGNWPNNLNERLTTARPARIDSYENIAGPVAARVRAVGVRAAVGVPIVVDGSVRGLAAVGSVEPGPMPADTETRISRFAEVVATALVAGYREEQKKAAPRRSISASVPD